MIRCSMDAIRAASLKAGLSRAEAWVFAIIGYWEQVEGGKKMGPGFSWRWRTYDDIGSAIGYSTKSVQRAIKALTQKDLIQVRRIHNPTRPGQTVNAYRLRSKGRATIDEAVAKGTAPPARSGPPRQAVPEETGCPVRTGQSVSSHKQDTNQNTGTITKQRERKAADISCWDCFREKGEVWEDLRPDDERWFWAGYSKLIKLGFNETIGSINLTRQGWVRDYLSMFKDGGFSPEDAVQAVALAIYEWDDVGVQLLNENTKMPEWRWARRYPHPYDLGVLGHIIFNHYNQALTDDLELGGGTASA